MSGFVVVIIAIVAFNIGLMFGAFWSEHVCKGTELGHDTRLQEWRRANGD